MKNITLSPQAMTVAVDLDALADALMASPQAKGFGNNGQAIFHMPIGEAQLHAVIAALREQALRQGDQTCPTFGVTYKLATEEYRTLVRLLRKARDDEGFSETVREQADQILAGIVLTTHPAKV